MKRHDVQELLAKLYLRLNGYFLTDLIIHSDEFAKNTSQIDIIGVRFPYHDQPDRGVPSSSYLMITPNKINIIIGEVKGGKEQVQINNALRANKSAIKKMLQWIGVLSDQDISDITDRLQIAMTPKDNVKPDNFIEVLHNEFSIRPIVFAVDRHAPKDNQSRYISGDEIMEYIWKCLRPSQSRNDCSVVYSYDSWGYSLTPLIKYFKDVNRNTTGTVNDLYSFLGV